MEDRAFSRLLFSRLKKENGMWLFRLYDLEISRSPEVPSRIRSYCRYRQWPVLACWLLTIIVPTSSYHYDYYYLIHLIAFFCTWERLVSYTSERKKLVTHDHCGLSVADFWMLMTATALRKDERSPEWPELWSKVVGGASNPRLEEPYT